MQTDIDPRDLIGHKAVDRNGDKIGTVDEVYLDDATGEPEWAAVRTGIFGRDAFVPLTTSEFAGDELRVPYDKSLIKESPDFGVGQHLSPAQELQLYRYYGLDTGNPAPPASVTNGSAPAVAAAAAAASDRSKDLDFGKVSSTPSPATSPEGQTMGAPTAFTSTPQAAAPMAAAPAPAHPDDTPTVQRPAAQPAAPPHTQQHTQYGAQTHPQPMPAAEPRRPAAEQPAAERPTVERPPAEQGAGTSAGSPSAPVEITCREERLDITTQWHVLGTARLRKYVTSAPVERKVPVVRERVRVERVPVTDAERASLAEQDIAEAVEEVTLREERPVVRKYLAPIERVRLVVERYTEEAVVREELRREQVEIHDGTVGSSGSPGGPSNGTAQRSAPGNGAMADTVRPEPLRPS
ncbi:PRC and DUF2382 domain-containing protein [Kitasatospora sp. NPDC088346]|uniref:PRC and DUF2382 domain-containing protein n=1 Tax=Kitasatospora sp. NPDC088346 TaxID=3364073 RepID=UPI00382535C7